MKLSTILEASYHGRGENPPAGAFLSDKMCDFVDEHIDDDKDPGRKMRTYSEYSKSGYVYNYFFWDTGNTLGFSVNEEGDLYWLLDAGDQDGYDLEHASEEEILSYFD